MVTEQYTVTTQRYNFPQPSMDTSLPQRFVEQSIHSLRQVRNQPFQLNQQTIQQDSLYENIPMTLQLKRQPLPLTPRTQETLIAAVDTSTIKIGETSTGIIIAVRGANVWKQNRAYRYKRLGPFIFHITEDNKKDVFNALEKSYSSTQYGSSHQSTPNLLQMPMRLASLLERWLQAMIAKVATNGVLLFDGSLTSGTIDTPVQRMREILMQIRMEAVERLIGNDVFEQSYPETLRLAHILCTFTANEVLAIQHFITRKHGIQIINRPDMHRLLFGSFGREGYA